MGARRPGSWGKWRSPALVAGVLAVGFAAAPSANAGTYGEIGHFGAKGTAEGQFEGGLETNAIGVDPRDNSVYVVDLPGEKAAEKNEFRLQKFKANIEGKYEEVASVRFKPADDEREETDLVEGVAVDPSTNRVYLLSAEERNPGKVGEVDPEVSAAAQIFAFSTIESGKALVPAGGAPQEGKELGVLAGTKVLNPLSKTRGQSLLEPSGIAVDPTTGEVIILAEEDYGSSEGNRIVLQRVHDKGELGARWTDQTNYFEDEASSPAVTSTGRVLVQGFDQIDEVPANFASSAAPTVFGQTLLEPGVERLTTLPGEPEAFLGGALSIGEDGTIYDRAGIADQYSSEPFKYPGIDEFTSAGVEKGWTGGQSVSSVGEAGPCKIGFSVAPQIAAGKNGDVFVASVDRQLAAPVDQILEFGPGGSGCPVGSATKPVATVDGVEVAEGEPIPVSETVRLSSVLTESNALEVEWEFGDGETDLQPVDQHQRTELTHRFKATGTLTVKERIHTDDLEEPVIEVQSHVEIVSSRPTVVTGQGEPAGPDGETLGATVNPNGAEVTECEFEYGTATVDEKSAPCSTSPGSGTTTVPVSATVEGLAPHTTYQFAIFAKNAGGESTGATASFTTGPPPTITKLSVKRGPAAGGTMVRVTGTGFVGVTAVTFGPAGAVSYAVGSSTSLLAVAPPGTTGTIEVHVRTAGGESAATATDRFAYGAPTVTSVGPDSGARAGGYSVTVKGSGFALGSGTKFRFGKALATSVSCSSTTECEMLAPAGAKPGTVEVRAISGEKTSKKSPPADQFSYE